MLPRTNINIVELKQSEGFDRLDTNTQALALLLHEQRDRPRIEYENLNLTIISEHNQTREVVLQGNAQIIKEIREASGQPFGITHNTPNSGEHAGTKEDISVGTKASNDLLDANGKLYWIHGKAGSGKSTLMKFLYDDRRMDALLRTWAGELPLVVVGHFFWNSGDILQMSQKGLLRVLLYEVLRKHPKLIPVVLHKHVVSDISADPQSWSLLKLRKAFDNLATQQIVQVKLCFFIDGLDEYNGNYAELVEIFKRHSESPNVKSCLSSRPLVVFDDCLSGYPSLRLQDLTRGDIRVFVSERLGKDQRMLAMTLEELGKVTKLRRLVII